MRLERESRERMADSNGNVTGLEDNATLAPGAEAGAGPGRVDAALLRDGVTQNRPASSRESGV
jgi:hypothetical protein